MAQEDRKSAAPGGQAARKAAVGLLVAVLEEGQLLAAAVDAADGPLAGLAPDDRARAQRLASETLRHLGPADAVLKPFVRKPPPPAARHLLRLSVVELCHMGAAAHGVVDSAVSLAGSDPATARVKGLVNAVLRRVAEDGPEIWARQQAQRLPNWLRGRLQSAYGGKVTAAIETAHAVGAPLDLTARDAAALAETLGGDLLPTGSVRLSGSRQVSGLPGYDTGAFWVQDAAAALPARVLAATPGETVLDLCAAPGGKTLQLAAAGASVTALDASEARLRRLHDNLRRTGLEAKVVVADALTWKGGAFDAVLLDAPCSATGTIRRHPDLPFVKQSSDIRALAALQQQMLDRALGWVKPGGRLVYCTCSLLPEEGEDQIAGLLERTPGLWVDQDALAALPGIDPAWLGPLGLRLRPDFWAERGGMDGFFITLLRREA
ncbi:RsmB/NOP family class I SAM-dependent RNA methyltransferase [Meridianimarinicoccus sp. MJW13]|uniref:RsmB/NOP family class I SAM-dependent RNA methyltransferase n=1 Tax=Meridianimarinicoccus sp. MJW13 TaxID=2720031 RepID=UPI00186893E3|nr:transcription antitermination factor NusB [Fluviibacterium sp. MJW13]